MWNTNKAYAINTTESIDVCVYQFHPLIFSDESGTPQGIFIDIIKEIAKEEAWQLNFVKGSWSECLNWGREAKIDLIASIIHQQDRETFLDFPQNYVVNIWGQVYIHKNTTIHSILDFEGKTIALLKDGSHASNFKKLAESFNVNCKYQNFDSFKEVAESVSLGKSDAGVFANIHGYTYESTHPIKQTQILFNLKQLKYASAKGTNTHLIKAIDKHLKKWKADKHSLYYNIFDKWFRIDKKEVLPSWFWNLIYSLGGLVIFIAFWMFLLKSQIKSKTDELLKSQESLKFQGEILNRMLEGVYVVREDGLIVYTNPEFAKMFGYEPDELTGKHVSIVNYTTEKSAEKIAKEIMDIIAENGTWQGEIHNIKKDGTPFWCLANVSVFDHPIHGKVMVSVHTDINERKITEKEFIDLFNLSQDLMCISSIEGKILKVNPFWETTLGYTAAEIVDLGWEKLVHPDDLKPVKREIEKQLNGKPINDFVNRFRCKDGAYKTLEWKAIPSTGGKVYATARDITGRIKADKEKEEIQEKLQQAIKMQAVGTMAGGIAHEFNNLLGVIMGCADMARDEAPQDSFISTQLDKVMIASYRVKDLVKQILTFSRQAQQKKLSINLCLILKESFKLIHTSIPASVDINENIAPSCGNAIVDPTEIQQIIMNLCSNAVWAMNEKGTIDVSLHQVRLNEEIALEKGLSAGNYIELIFSDTGYGIDEETISRIFDPFYTTKEVGEGTGMGLSIIYSIMESYGGIITVESEVGKGTTFHLYFPVTEEIAIEKAKKVEKILKGTERILFVDDEEMYAEMVSDMIDRLGYDVDLHIDSTKALKAFKASPDSYDLIITDQIMPNLSGEELVKEIRVIRPEMPIILCTGYSSQMDEEKSKSFGINAFVYKPIVKKDIAILIRKVLDAS